MRPGYTSSLLISIAVLSAAESFAVTSAAAAQEAPTQYLAFQIFTGVRDSPELRASYPPPAQDTAASVAEIVRVIGAVGDERRKLAFIVGPLSFDNTDDQIRTLIRDSFSTAIANNIAVGFHIDDSMFWGRLSHLLAPENLEWLDWAGTPNTGRRLDWSSTPFQVMPQLCFNSPAVEAEVGQRARLIAEAVTQGMAVLQEAAKPELFAGVIAGWETQIGQDFATQSYLGYCALTKKGYSAENLPADMDEARVDVTREFINLWSSSLADAGVPEAKIFSHTAFTSKVMFDTTRFFYPENASATYLETVNFSPPRVSFGPRHQAGFSTFPKFGSLTEIHAERAKNDNPPWASTEGSAIDPGQPESGVSEAMEGYLGTLFNQGAVLVNLFGWGVGDPNNAFRRGVENENAIAAYQKFLRGEPLTENEKEQVPSSEFLPKIRRVQDELPPYVRANGKDGVVGLYETLNQQLGARRFIDAEATVDALLSIIGQ